MPRFGGRLFAFVFFVLPIVSAAQTNAGSTAPSAALPSDPLQFFDLAAKVNGLQSEAAGPWHVKATFQIYDDQGKALEAGTYEAFWKSPNSYKMIYSSPSDSRTIWANDSGTFATSNPKWPADVEWMIRRSLFDLVPEGGVFKDWKLDWTEATVGIEVGCIEAVPVHLTIKQKEIPVFCFESGTPILRFGSGAFQRHQESLNNMITIGKSHVAKDIQLARLGKTYFKLHIDLLVPLADPGDDLFHPDSGSALVPSGLLLDSDLRDLHTTNEVDIFTSQGGTPNQAQFATSWISLILKTPEIIVQVLVNQKGKVVETRPLKGDMHSEFQAVAAASQWEFKPYLVQGKPNAFYTEIEFNATSCTPLTETDPTNNFCTFIR